MARPSKTPTSAAKETTVSKAEMNVSITEESAKKAEIVTQKAAPVVSVKEEKATEKPAKKTTAKKATTKKTEDAPKQSRASRKPKTSFTVEFPETKYTPDEIIEEAMKRYTASHPDEKIKSCEVYYVAAENTAYYVINGEGGPEFKILFS